MLSPAFHASLWPVQWPGQDLSVKVVQMPLMLLLNICSDIFSNVSHQLFSIWPHSEGLQTRVYLRVCLELCLGKERESVGHYWHGGGRTEWGSGESRLFLEPAAAYTGSSSWQSGLLHRWTPRSLPSPGASNAPNLPPATSGTPGALHLAAPGCTWLHLAAPCFILSR